jgi:hypothetical protein
MTLREERIIDRPRVASKAEAPGWTPSAPILVRRVSLQPALMNPKEDGMKERHRPRIMDELLGAVEADGVPGLIQTLAREIGPNQPQVECVDADYSASGAMSAEEVWDAMLEYAACWMDALISTEVEPPDPPEPPPPPPPDPDGYIRVGTAVLATLLVYMHRRSRRETAG